MVDWEKSDFIDSLRKSMGKSKNDPKDELFLSRLAKRVDRMVQNSAETGKPLLRDYVRFRFSEDSTVLHMYGDKPGAYGVDIPPEEASSLRDEFERLYGLATRVGAKASQPKETD